MKRVFQKSVSLECQALEDVTKMRGRSVLHNVLLQSDKHEKLDSLS